MPMEQGDEVVGELTPLGQVSMAVATLHEHGELAMSDAQFLLAISLEAEAYTSRPHRAGYVQRVWLRLSDAAREAAVHIDTHTVERIDD